MKPVSAWAALLALALLTVSTHADEAAAPSAAQVCVRGPRTFADALRVPLGAVFADDQEGQAPRPVLIVVDVTPYTAAAEGDLTKAFLDLDKQVGQPGRWQVARLGEVPGKAEARPGLLALQLTAVFAQDSAVEATLPALERTLRKANARGATVVYLADWHFEDEVGLEPFIAHLRDRGHTFHVLGSESAFGRAWNDGFLPPDRGTRDARGQSKLYSEGVGRAPFGPDDATAPWHGGDTAWPHLPLRFWHADFSTEFPVDLPPPPPARRTESRYGGQAGGGARRGGDPEPEDLQDRAKEENAKDALERYYFPLSSGFGSWPLMRAAGATGGRYVLWSWNPTGRSDLLYDYSRCNLFAPDLRPRSTILADLKDRPLALALLSAWQRIANDKIALAVTTAPVSENGRRPLEMIEAQGAYLHKSWDGPKEHKLFLALAPRYLAVMKSVLADLERALALPLQDGVDRRYHADAALLHHILLQKHFQLAEGLAAAKTLDTSSAWKDLPLHPTLASETFLRAERDPELVIPEDVPVYDAEAAAHLVAARRAFLEKFGGTPFGELVARNPVRTYKIVWVGYASGQPTKTSPSESDGRGPSTPPGRGSGGSGTRTP